MLRMEPNGRIECDNPKQMAEFWNEIHHLQNSNGKKQKYESQNRPASLGEILESLKPDAKKLIEKMRQKNHPLTSEEATEMLGLKGKGLGGVLSGVSKRLKNNGIEEPLIIKDTNETENGVVVKYSLNKELLNKAKS